MKRIKSLLALAAAVLLLLGCFTACGGNGSDHGNDQGSAPQSGVTEPETAGGSADGPLEIPAHIRNAMDAANALTGTHCFLAEDGSVIWIKLEDRTTSPVNLMYYANIPNAKKLVTSSALYNMFLLTEEGDLYYGMDRIAQGVLDIADSVEWARMGTERCVLAKEDGYYFMQGLINHTPETCMEGPLFDGACDTSRIRISGDHNDFLILDARGNVRLDMYDKTPADTYEDLDFLAWEDLVLIDLAKYIEGHDPTAKTVTVAGIQADGTVLACGDYAEEILSWGELSYLSMANGTIVGLLPDGTVKIAGLEAESLTAATAGWSNITAVEVGSTGNGNAVTAVDGDGNFYYLRCTRGEVADSYVISLEGSGEMGTTYRYCPDGSIYITRDNQWTKVGG